MELLYEAQIYQIYITGFANSIPSLITAIVVMALALFTVRGKLEVEAFVVVVSAFLQFGPTVADIFKAVFGIAKVSLFEQMHLLFDCFR